VARDYSMREKETPRKLKGSYNVEEGSKRVLDKNKKFF
jgi:hypothetical protein